MKRLSFLFILFSLFIPLTSLQANNEDLFSIVETSRTKLSPIAYAVDIQRPDVVKFLIDMNEDIDKLTPGIPIYYEFGDWNASYERIEDEPGKTPIEIAIEKDNLDLVKILLYYHPTNRANAEYEVWRYHPHSLYMKFGNGFASGTLNREKRSSPLIEALSRQNDEIIETIIKAHYTLNKLSDAFFFVKRANNKQYMRFWIQQIIKLWKNEEVEISEQVAMLFLTKSINQAIQERDYEALSLLTENGMLISKGDFEAAISLQDFDAITLLFNKGRMQPNFDPAEILLNNHLEHLIDLSNLKHLKPTIAKLDRVDLLELVIDEMDDESLLECSIFAAKAGSIQVLKFLALMATPMDQALLESIQSNQKEAFLFLVEQPLKEETLSEAITIAYKLHRYDMLSLLLDLN